MTRERLHATIIIGLLVLVCAGAAAWWLNTHERVEQKYRSSPSVEVLRKPLLAATLFLQELGFTTETSNGLDRFQQLPPTSDVIIGEHLGARLPDHRIEELLLWVENGGHLITNAQPSWDNDDPDAGDRLLPRLGVYLMQNEFENQPFDERPQFAVANGRLADGEWVNAQFSPRLHLVDKESGSHFALASEYGTHLMQIPYGSGRITLTTSFGLFHNPMNYLWQTFSEPTAPTGQDADATTPEEAASQPYIDDRDHAYILWSLVRGRGTVWLVQRIEATPLPLLFWRHAPQAAIALGVLLLFWLWWQYNRFGPLRGSVTPERRNILEHLLMSTIYTWRQDRAESLFAATRSDIELLIKRKHPQIAALPAAERVAKLAEHCELPVHQIERVFPGEWRNDWNGEREFIELTSLLQRIRKSL